MALTAYPQQVQESPQLYINAGITYAGQAATSTLGSTTYTWTAPLSNTTSSSAQGTGYQKLILNSSSCAITWSTSSLATQWGHVWFAEVANPYSAVSLTTTSSFSTTTVGVTAIGSTTVVVSNAAGIANGQVVTGTFVGNPTTVQSVSGNTVTLSAATTSIANTATNVTFGQTNQTLPVGSNYIFVASTAGLAVGAILSNASLAANTYVTAINGSVVSLSAVTTGTIAAGATVSSTPSITWSGVTWHNNSAPTQANNGRSLYQFYTPDNGTTIYGRQMMASLTGL